MFTVNYMCRYLSLLLSIRIFDISFVICVPKIQTMLWKRGENEITAEQISLI